MSGFRSSRIEATIRYDGLEELEGCMMDNGLGPFRVVRLVQNLFTSKLLDTIKTVTAGGRNTQWAASPIGDAEVLDISLILPNKVNKLLNAVIKLSQTQNSLGEP